MIEMGTPDEERNLRMASGGSGNGGYDELAAVGM